MKRIVGILVIVLLLYILVLTSTESAHTLANHQNLAKRVALYGVLTLGAGILIIAGGIDLSMGSVVCLAGVSLGLLLNAPVEDSGNVFYLTLATIGSLMVGFAVHDRLRDHLRPYFSVLLAMLSVPLAPLALGWLLYQPLQARLSRKPVAGAFALVLGLALHLVPLGLSRLLQGQQGWLAVLTVLAGGVAIGLFHGVLVTRLRLQPFIVTLCGLFIWRGMAYWLALDDPMAPVRGVVRFLSFGQLYGDAPVKGGSAGTIVLKDLSNRYPDLASLANGYPDSPAIQWFADMPQRFWLLLLLGAIFMVLLHLSVYGRYLFAVGANEQAARYAGINADRYKIVAYVLCSMMAALGGILLSAELGSTQPSMTGQSYELYAITGAVLGGCSLRGGEGTVLGMLLGPAVLPLLNNFIVLSGLPSELELFIVGVALLLGTVLDELLKRRGAKKGRF